MIDKKVSIRVQLGREQRGGCWNAWNSIRIEVSMFRKKKEKQTFNRSVKQILSRRFNFQNIINSNDLLRTNVRTITMKGT